MRRVLTTLAVIGLLAAACATDDLPENVVADGNGGAVVEIDGEEIRLTSALSGFDSCGTLLEHLRSEGAERVGPWGFNDGWYGGWWPVDGVLAEGADFATDDADTGSDPAPATSIAAEGGDGFDPAEGVDFSGTNVQETGVDEADIVKTDGERIYIVASGELVVVDVATRTVVGTVVVPQGDRAELFIDGDDLLLINQSWYGGDFPVPLPAIEGDAEAEFADDLEVDGIAVDEAIAPDFGGSRTTITRIRVEGNSPRILETLAAEGDYVSARAVDGTARIIVRSNPQYNFPFVFPQSESGEQIAEDANRDAVRNSELDDWLPSYQLLDANGSQTGSGLLVPCEQVHAPTEFAGFGVLSVLTVDVDGAINPAVHPRCWPRVKSSTHPPVRSTSPPPPGSTGTRSTPPASRSSRTSPRRSTGSTLLRAARRPTPPAVRSTGSSAQQLLVQ